DDLGDLLVVGELVVVLGAGAAGAHLRAGDRVHRCQPGCCLAVLCHVRDATGRRGPPRLGPTRPAHAVIAPAGHTTPTGCGQSKLDTTSLVRFSSYNPG